MRYSSRQIKDHSQSDNGSLTQEDRHPIVQAVELVLTEALAIISPVGKGMAVISRSSATRLNVVVVKIALASSIP